MRLLHLGILWAGLSGCITVTPLVNSTDISKLSSNDIRELKTGESCSVYFLGFIGPFGRRGTLSQAIFRARISNVKIVEEEFNHYGIYAERCIKVYGQPLQQSLDGFP